MSRVGEVWMLPVGGSELGLVTPCLITRERTELIQPKMSEYRPEKRVPCQVYDVVLLETNELDVWYAHRPLEEEHEPLRRVL